MRQQVVRAAHDDFGHFSADKTLHRLCQHYWFPRMRAYVERYIACCIACLYNKKKTGRKEGYLHPIEKPMVPFEMVHVDHLGPFPKSSKGNLHILAVIDGFTKFAVLRPVKSTNSRITIHHLSDIFRLFGSPKVLVTDQGSSFTCKKFGEFCDKYTVRHVLNAVATPRANGQVERLNRTILGALLASNNEERKWDETVIDVQFAINNVPSKTTGKTPSELLYGYHPRSGLDAALIDEVSTSAALVEDILQTREEANRNIMEAQKKSKEAYDKKRKKPRVYKVGDLVGIEKFEPNPGNSRKLMPPYAGPMVVKKVLPNDRYMVCDMDGSHRTTRSKTYDRITAVDRMKPWVIPGGVSDDTEQESGSDGVVLSD